MRIYAVRHGQTQWNAEDRVCGSTDLPLNEVGFAQARALAEKAAAYQIDLILCSPLLRARQTAEAIAERCGVPIVIEERLREQDFGEAEGKSRQDPEYKRNKVQFSYRHPGGESPLQLIARVYAVLEDVKRKYQGKTVLLVCHGCVCRAIRSYFVSSTNEEYFRFLEDNTGIREYDL